MKIASYILLGFLSYVEVLAGEIAFDRAVEAYRTYSKAHSFYVETIHAYEETKLAWGAYLAAGRTDATAKFVWEKARDANKEVKEAYAIYQTALYGYNKALHAIEAIRLASTAQDEAKRALDEAAEKAKQRTFRDAQYGRPLDVDAILAPVKKARSALDEADDIYFTILEIFEETIRKAYEKELGL